MSKLYIIILFFIFPLSANELDACGNNDQARLLSKLIKTDDEQKRVSIRCNKVLTIAAEAKARKMAEFGLVTHNLGGSPNSYLENAGYILPNHYGSKFDSNQVEAIAGGYSNASRVWKAFKNSKGHRTHLLGEHAFYIEQDEIGVAFIKEWSSPHVEYWVVYLTKGYSQDQSYSGDTNEIPNKSSFILQNNKQNKPNN